MAKIALVTGASGGIGTACARKFAGEGYRVIVHYHRAKEEAENLALRIGGVAIRADLRSEAAADALTDEVLGRFGRIDALVNNAGVSQSGQVQDLSLADWEQMMAGNAASVFLMTRAVLPSMIEAQSGAIVNISSMWGLAGASCESAYAASKGAVIAFTKSIAKEVGPSGIRVNCVAPGVIETAMLSQYRKEDLAALAEDTPLGRLGTAEEVAEAVSFLASEKASFITGQVLTVDGGFLLHP